MALQHTLIIQIVVFFFHLWSFWFPHLSQFFSPIVIFLLVTVKKCSSHLEFIIVQTKQNSLPKRQLFRTEGATWEWPVGEGMPLCLVGLDMQKDTTSIWQQGPFYRNWDNNKNSSGNISMNACHACSKESIFHKGRQNSHGPR
jgi:hypothetical protein